MNKKPVEYSKGEMGTVKIIKNFLQEPSDLVLKDDNVKCDAKPVTPQY
jgi:hypothetical protein